MQSNAKASDQLLCMWRKCEAAVLLTLVCVCCRFVVQTFDALVDVEGAEAVSQALDDSDLCADLCASTSTLSKQSVQT